MPDPNPTPAPDAPVETPQAPQVPVEMANAVIEAQRNAALAERRAMAAEQAANRFAAQQNRPAPQPDELRRYTEQDLTMSPEDKYRSLTDAIDTRARAAAAQAAQVAERRMAQQQEAMRAEMALQTVMAQRPEWNDPKNASNVAAALTKAKYEADAQGVTLSPAQLAMRAGATYDEMFKKPAQVPFVEGSRPDASGMQPAEQPPGPSFLEERYGMKAGKIRPLPDFGNAEQVMAMNNEYVLAKNKPLMDKGAVTGLEEITRVLNQ